MPKIQKLFYLDVTPQMFIDACDKHELHEVILLANKKLESISRLKSQPISLENLDTEKCTCPTAACMKSCNKDCDEK